MTTSHTMTTESLEPEASLCPDSSRASEVTADLWPLRVTCEQDYHFIQLESGFFELIQVGLQYIGS